MFCYPLTKRTVLVRLFDRDHIRGSARAESATSTALRNSSIVLHTHAVAGNPMLMAFEVPETYKVGLQKELITLEVGGSLDL